MTKSKRKIPNLEEWKQLRSRSMLMKHGSTGHFGPALAELERIRGRALGREECTRVIAEISGVASYYRWNAGVHDGTPTKSETIANMRKLLGSITKTQDLMSSAGWVVESRLDEALKKSGHSGFLSSMNELALLGNAGIAALEFLEKQAAIPHRRIHPGVILLAQCRSVLKSAGVEVGITKGGSPLVRFTRRVFAYATGLRAGSFDHHVRELRKLVKSGKKTYSESFRTMQPRIVTGDNSAR